MKEKMLIPKNLIRLVSFILGGLMGFAAVFSQPRLSPLDEVDALRREIMVLNLVQGLELSFDQTQFLLEKARESQRLTEEARLNYNLRKPELLQIMAEIRKYRQENQEVPAELSRRFHALETEIKKEALRVQEALHSLAREVEKSLAPYQLNALEKYVPCVIPPKGENHIGQAVDLEGISWHLARIRNIPDRMYRVSKDEVVKRTLQRLKEKTGRALSEEATAEISSQLSAFYDEVRSLSEADFEIQKESLAKEFSELLKPKAPRLSLTQKIEAFLLRPEIIPFLENKLREARQNN
ncbi:MAG: hypothetical protein ACUVWQ_05370 [Candidatus Aminicenantales bacterium]